MVGGFDINPTSAKKRLPRTWDNLSNILKKGESSMDAFLKMIDDLQTPKHKTNHKYRSYFPLLSFTIEIKPTIKSIQI